MLFKKNSLLRLSLLLSTLLFASCLSSKTKFSPSDDIDWKTVPENYNVKQDGVPYGTIETVSYYSTVTECERKCCVLLPDGYTPEKKYPVIYLLHALRTKYTSSSANAHFVPCQ